MYSIFMRTIGYWVCTWICLNTNVIEIDSKRWLLIISVFFVVVSWIYWKTQVSIIKTDRQWIDWYLLRIWCEFRNEWKFFRIHSICNATMKITRRLRSSRTFFVRVYAYVIRFIPFDQFGCFVSHRCKRKWAFLDNKT